MKLNNIITFTMFSFFTSQAIANTNGHEIQNQNNTTIENKTGEGFGPQSPRDIDNLNGNNKRIFSTAPEFYKMNLCNIHFHKNAEHKGGEFTTKSVNGDGYIYNGKLNKQELKPFASNFNISSGDTIEVHYVHSTADVKPGPTLASCLSDNTSNPQLRVETQVYVLVNDKNAKDFIELARTGIKNNYHQALGIPNNTGKPIIYSGSTTGPSYNQKNSPFQVTWSVRPKVEKVDIASVETWLKGNEFNEDHAHGVRNIITNSELLSSGY